MIDDEWGENLVEHPLVAYSRENENLIITPHIGDVTYKSQELAFADAAQKLLDFFRLTSRENKGQPESLLLFL